MGDGAARNKSSAGETHLILEELQRLVTEQRNERTRDIDLVDVETCLQWINDEDAHVAPAVRAQIPLIARAVGAAERSLRAGGRLVYLGAGTSGRLGVLDASECPPTFGSDPDQVIGVIAGGSAALVRAQEGAEDREDAAVRDLVAIGLESRDTLVGLSASRRTPYVIAGLRHASGIGAATVFVTCNTPAADVAADIVIAVVVGPEVVAGSTRLKSGTAQKLVLNMISTATMIRLGKVYENLMVDLRPSSIKLEERSKGILMQLLAIPYADAVALLDAARGSVKLALFMGLAGCARDEAEARLQAAGGVLRRALGKELT
ncbi:MAG TPA: N-acetylmuramic acid 6-phosphate etherase [Candidatus Krumholzibacteria bacterium]|nr:N-acetylmuramic acid 6-phosphate etherase [Candidatus Krumholzibacteria bacterium]